MAGASITSNRHCPRALKAGKRDSSVVHMYMSANVCLVLVSICAALMQAVNNGGVTSAVYRVLSLSF